MSGLFRCQCKALPMPEQLCQWPLKQITWYQHVSLSQIDPDTIARTYRDAWQAWAEVCGIQPIEQEVAKANCQAFNGDGAANGFDDANTILALTELPCGATPETCLHQVVNDHEQWTPEFLRLVLLHEIGHFLGLGHSANAADVMYPYYNPTLTGLSGGDISQAQARYGPPATKPSASPAVSWPDVVKYDVHVESAGVVEYMLRIDFPAAGDYEIVSSLQPKGQ